MFKTHGLDMKRSSEHVQIAYRLVVRLVNTNLPSVYNGLSISENQNDKGQNTIVKVDSLSQMQTPVTIQWDQVTFPDNWDINIHPTLMNEVHAPSHVEAHRLGHTDQYKIVSSRLPEYRSQLARQCVPSSSIAPSPSSIASTSSRPISVPLHCAHNEYVLIEEKPRCKHCNKLLQHISTVNTITVLTSETLAIRHEVSSSASAIVSAIDPSHKVLNWQSNALKDLAEMNLIQQKLLHNLSAEVQALKLDLSRVLHSKGGDLGKEAASTSAESFAAAIFAKLKITPHKKGELPRMFSMIRKEHPRYPEPIPANFGPNQSFHLHHKGPFDDDDSDQRWDPAKYWNPAFHEQEDERRDERIDRFNTSIMMEECLIHPAESFLTPGEALACTENVWPTEYMERIWDLPPSENKYAETPRYVNFDSNDWKTKGNLVAHHYVSKPSVEQAPAPAQSSEQPLPFWHSRSSMKEEPSTSRRRICNSTSRGPRVEEPTSSTSSNTPQLSTIQKVGDMVLINIDNSYKKETWKSFEHLYNSCWYGVNYKELTQSEAVLQVTSGFTGILRRWWDNLDAEFKRFILQGGQQENFENVISLFFAVICMEFIGKLSTISGVVE